MDARPAFLQVIAAYQLDMYPGFPGHIKWLEKGVCILPCGHCTSEIQLLTYYSRMLVHDIIWWNLSAAFGVQAQVQTELEEAKLKRISVLNLKSMSSS